MKKFLLALVCLSACTKEDAAPTYNDFTPISGRFTLYNNGFLRYNKHDTTSVLSDLKLRIRPSGAQDIYEFQGRFSARETYDILFYVDKSRTGTGPWTDLATGSTSYVDGKVQTRGGSSNSGTLSASGNKFTASFDHSGVTGVLKQ